MTKFKSCYGVTMHYRFIWLLSFCMLCGTAANAKSLQVDSTSATNIRFTKLANVKHDMDKDGTSDLIGDTVTVAGVSNISTGILHENYLQIFIQNDSTGISLFATSFDKPVKRGDSVIATGVIQKYYGLTEIHVTDYRVIAGKGAKLPEIPLQKAMNNLSKYEGMLVSGTGTVIGKGDRFNGKYLMVSPTDDQERAIMVYVTNFHSNYQQFDFESISIGDDLRISGILSLYNPDTRGEDENTYKIHLRVPSDLSIVGISRNQMLLWGSIGIIITLVAIGWIISLRSTVKSQTEDLKKSLEDKEILLKEIHHRVKNNLAIMSGLFELQLDGTENEQTKIALRNSQSRLKSMALVHDKLYRTASLTNIEMSQYVEELVRSLHDTFIGPEQEIKMNFEIDDLSLDIDQAIPCGLLINEIVVNSFKHGFKNRKKGSLKIIMQKQNGNARLVISDDGHGIPEDFDISTSNSLGMMLIETFKNQLDARLDISNTVGTRFSFTFPIQ